MIDTQKEIVQMYNLFFVHHKQMLRGAATLDYPSTFEHCTI